VARRRKEPRRVSGPSRTIPRIWIVQFDENTTLHIEEQEDV
jgi:hypothetical protein